MSVAEELLTKQDEAVFADESLKELVEAGVFYGRKKSRTNPRMKPFILSTRNEIEIIDLEKTKQNLEKAIEFLKEKVRTGGLVLFVGTQPAAEDVYSVATELGMPVVNTRWLGGTLTNFRVISKRIEYYLKLKADWTNNAFVDKYTKKERVGIERELRRLEELFNGLSTLKTLPAATVIIDPHIHAAAVQEAKILNIPIVAFTNTDGDPDKVNHLVPGNTKAKVSINWFLGQLKDGLKGVKMVTEVAGPKKESNS